MSLCVDVGATEPYATEMILLTAIAVGVTMIMQFALNFFDVYQWKNWYRHIDGYPDADSTGYIFGIMWTIIYITQIFVRIMALKCICGEVFDALVILFLVDTLLNNLWVFCFMGGWISCNCCLLPSAACRARAGLVVIVLDLLVVSAILTFAIASGDAATIIFAIPSVLWLFVASMFNVATANSEAKNVAQKGPYVKVSTSR